MLGVPTLGGANVFVSFHLEGTVWRPAREVQRYRDTGPPTLWWLRPGTAERSELPGGSPNRYRTIVNTLLPNTRLQHRDHRTR